LWLQAFCGSHSRLYVQSEHDEPHGTELGDQEQHHDSQLDNRVFNHGLYAQDPESDTEIEVVDFRHRVKTDNDHDEAMQFGEEHEPATLDDHNEEFDEVEFTVWLDDNGDLQTNLQDPDGTWHELKASWAIQKVELEEQTKDEEELAWLSVDFEKYSKKCLWSAVTGRTHYWTNSEAGSFACRACANNQVICFGNIDGVWVALPLPYEVVEEDSTMKQMYISYRGAISRACQARGVWVDC
jgi:hypothetical protein